VQPATLQNLPKNLPGKMGFNSGDVKTFCKKSISILHGTIQKGIVAVPTGLLFKRFCFCSTNHATALLDASRCWFESVQLLKLQEKIRSDGARLW
jgi:hypothetical protein